MEHYSTAHRLNDHEIDVVLAALRLLQQMPHDQIPAGILDIAGESLGHIDISELCERLNMGCVDDQENDHLMLLRRIRAEMSRPDWNSDLLDRVETALEQGGWPIFVTDHEGWYLDEHDGRYTVTSEDGGPYASNDEAIAAIGKRFAAGSHWHGEVLDAIGMTACGYVLAMPDAPVPLAGSYS
ncbi:hypothetical protein [Kushneria indalinina]|uniref:Uncharacterized protein n=1 Tax=Kushneria indalinina DSM 14324 TaxID=1122140 RepID=A0A3D9DSG7_9GAMM|nr:hypothetical protein [Kushneria indalinina]REC93349.1 hypothetical protein C8D72_3393 [Kushneria indalinina DSM 14324]